MKYAPLKDLCALGGWKSPQTVLMCYQRADSASMQQALAARRRLEAWSTNGQHNGQHGSGDHNRAKYHPLS
jgi:hypothetical protein